jgi:catechol 2,3-dioxygenase-like lactoylglutathione lyase family enzyme
MANKRQFHKIKITSFKEEAIVKQAKIYETHVNTKNLEASIAFYENLGLEVAFKLEDRRAAFIYLGQEGAREQMLGIWEVKEEQFSSKHFALYVSPSDFEDIPHFLSERGIELRPSFGLEATEPVVHAWMPAAAYYFNDPDENSLEYLTLLEGEARPEWGVLHLSDWKNRMNK